MKTIFLKIFATFILGFIIFSGLILYATFKTIRDDHIEMLTSSFNDFGNGLIPKTISNIENNNLQDLDFLIKNSSTRSDTRVTIISLDGSVLADSRTSPTLMGKMSNRPEIISAINKFSDSASDKSISIINDNFYLIKPVRSISGNIAYLIITNNLDSFNRLIDSQVMHVIDYSLIILAFSLIIILVFSRKISKPIRFLQKAAHQVAAGDFDVKVYLDNNDELKDLASSFNYMTERIKELFSEISVHKEELEQVISSINEGFVVIDENGKLLIINEGFLNIVNRREVIGKFYWEVIQNTVFTENIKKILKKRKGSSFEVKINEHFYWCGANYMDVKNEIALIMNDITQLKNLEDIKKDFVMNVSHELRTPLTAIKGFIETLDEEDQIEKVREYLEIIGRHTNRLINIVEDLLLLSNLENNTSVLIKSDVNIKELIEVVLKIFEQKVKEKRLRLEFRFDENIPTIQADAFRLEQLMINLIDNAVKYTDEGSITISINMTVSGRIRLVIQDTGIGIPKVQHDRIFERFYTVDKSRSRRLGSTGLGLSIVKHIVLLHKGEIYVDSTIEKGTKFVVVLPVGQEIIMP